MAKNTLISMFAIGNFPIIFELPHKSYMLFLAKIMLVWCVANWHLKFKSFQTLLES